MGHFRPVSVPTQEQGQGQQQQYQSYPQQYQAPRTITPQNDFTSISRRLALTDQVFKPQPIPQSRPTTTKNSWGLSSETLLKLAELKGLLYQHSANFPNFDVILQGAKHFAMQGDNTFLDEKLAFFRNFDVFNLSDRQPKPGQSNVL
jgi:hypothetical protein